MKVALVDNGTSLLKKLQVLIPDEEVLFSNDCVDLKHQDFDVLILSGSSVGPLIGNEELYKKEIDIVSARKTPVIGICFGCEIIAHSYGMDLEQMDEQKKGLTKFRVISKNDIFGNTESFQAYENHAWKIKTVIDPFEILVESEHAPAIIKHKEYPIFGLQFHPENLIDLSYGDEIFINIFNSFRN